jgi:hypothetical protein
MTASSSDVARMTNDGVVLTATNQQIKDLDPNAENDGETERPLLFDDPAAGQVILNEAFALLSAMGRPHEGIAIGDSAGLGSVVPVWPKAPRATIVDESRGLIATTALRAYSFDMGEDTYALELVGLPIKANPAGKVTMDSTVVTVDTTLHTMDER